MEQLVKYIPYILPILVLQLGLMVFSLVDLARREKVRGPKWLWVVIIVFGELVGPVVYLLVGRVEE
jgi:hypothetical protein